MFSQNDYALYSKSLWIIDRNDSQIRLNHFSINRVFKNLKKFICIQTNRQINFSYKNYVTSFSVKQSFFTNLLISFRNC